MPRSISVAMIVKDEAESLAECLSSIAKIADEICIVDTGSQDNTVDIARSFNAKISFFIWCDDFAAARNESLRGCTKDWVFVLDADERLAEEDLNTIRSLAEGPQNVAYRFLTRNYTNTDTVGEFQACATNDPYAHNFTGWYPSYKVRFFPNRQGIQFQGKVHELVNESLTQRNIQIELCNAPIHHYAWMKSPERILRKQALYLQLGHDKIQTNPTDPKAYAELGNQYAELHDYAQAAAAYRESLRLNPANPEVLKDLGGVLHLLRRSEDAKHALKLALQLNPTLPDAWRNLGVIYADEKEWDMAVACFEQGLTLNPAWTDGLRFLSVALAGASRQADAANAIRRALETEPTNVDYLQLYIHHMLRLERRSEARTFLESLVAAGANHAEIHNALGELSYYDELFDQAKKHFLAAGQGGLAPAFNNLGVVLYREHSFEEARQAFEACLQADPNHPGARANLEKTLSHLSRN